MGVMKIYLVIVLVRGGDSLVSMSKSTRVKLAVNYLVNIEVLTSDLNH